ncbi:MAG: hypothetical protein A3H98_11785 [Bacteroidetes bacterium RIFCSPLOWO2_02_FULL_36_8]|nr:MAG: hypothetical protein A3H98_11785 [Bacteroidetes bacterium RIFCSPLOWO2_02_FULL_36_8]OFY69452.1 MAG: hypothetical protein A3G23_00865 [Bacteroidetes bacterium RIFCSPLOWO2_12_FULL_37_12]
MTAFIYILIVLFSLEEGIAQNIDSVFINPTSDVIITLSDSSLIAGEFIDRNDSFVFLKTSRMDTLPIPKKSIEKIKFIHPLRNDLIYFKNKVRLYGSILGYDKTGVWFKNMHKIKYHYYYNIVDTIKSEKKYVSFKNYHFKSPNSPFILFSESSFPILNDHYFRVFLNGTTLTHNLKFYLFNQFSLGAGYEWDFSINRFPIFWFHINKPWYITPYFATNVGFVYSNLFNQIRKYSYRSYGLRYKSYFFDTTYENSHGFVYNLYSYGTPKSCVTAGFAYEIYSKTKIYQPALTFSGISYISRALAFFSENWFVPLRINYHFREDIQLKQGVLNYQFFSFNGIKISMRSTDLFLAFLLNPEDKIYSREEWWVFGFIFKF